MNPSDRVRKRLKEIHAELLHAHDNSHSYPSAISGSEREIVVHELLRHVCQFAASWDHLFCRGMGPGRRGKTTCG